MNEDAKKRKKSRSPKVPSRTFQAGWGNWQNWVNIVLLCIVLEIAVLSVEQANWITPQPLLTLVLFLSVVIALLFARIRIIGVFKHILGLVLGVVVTAWQAMNLLAPTKATSKFSHLLDVLQSWWQGTGTLLPGDDKIPFVVFITLLTWIIGYVSAWFVLRKNNAWVAVSLGAVVLLVNLSNLSDSYYIYFFLYFFAATLLITVTRMTGQSTTAGTASNYSGRSLFYLGGSLLCITALAASVSWITPQVRAPALQNLIATSLPWQSNIIESNLNVFNAVPSKQVLSTARDLKDLTFEGNWNQGDDVEFVVVSEHPSYWPMYVYDTYTSQGWKSRPAGKTLLDSNIAWANAEGLSSREKMQYAVTARIGTDVLFTAGDFISADMPVWVNTGSGGDITTVTALRVLDPGEHYTVSSFVSSATWSELSAAGENYPEWIKSVYLQLPSDFPDNIRRLSEEIIGEAATPSAKVKAIVNYLAKFTYKLNITPPPPGNDSVAYFLFNSKSGYCLHFASAAVVMLRSIDIPSRLAVGYLPGEPGKTAGQYLLRNKYYHAWPQVYFPGYGWVDIEATPGGAGNQVFADTLLASGPNIENLPQWDQWFGDDYLDSSDLSNSGSDNLLENGTGKEELSFAGKLGYALLFVFTAVLIVMLFIGLIQVMRSVSFRWLWRMDRDTLVYDAYTNMCTLAAIINLPVKPNQTPMEFAAELATTLPQKEAKALDFIVQAYMENRYRRHEGKLGLFEEAEFLRSYKLVYNALLLRLKTKKRISGKKLKS